MLHLMLDGIHLDICCVPSWSGATEPNLSVQPHSPFMGRPWLGLSMGSLMRITKVGRLCAHGYPGPISGGSLESQFGYCTQSLFGTSLFATTVVAMRW